MCVLALAVGLAVVSGAWLIVMALAITASRADDRCWDDEFHARRE